jgi:hypothetical protein
VSSHRCLQLFSLLGVLERMRTTSVRCLCCGNRTLSAPGTFELCPVCWWQDDGQDEADADVVRGGPNGTLSLTAARANFQACGASDPRFAGHVRTALPSESAAA